MGLREVAERAKRRTATSGGGERAEGKADGFSILSSPSSPSTMTTPHSSAAVLAHLSRAAELRAAGDLDLAIAAASAAVSAASAASEDADKSSSSSAAARAWFALGQLRAAAAHWHDAELAFGESARLEEEAAARIMVKKETEERVGTADAIAVALMLMRERRHEAARALFGAGVAQRMQGDSEAASGTLARAVSAAEEALGGAAAVEAEVEKRRKERRKKRKSSPLSPSPPLATLARSLLALSSSLDAQGGRTAEALTFARRAAELDEGAQRMAVAPLEAKLRKEGKEGSGSGGRL